MLFLVSTGLRHLLNETHGCKVKLGHHIMSVLSCEADQQPPLIIKEIRHNSE